MKPVNSILVRAVRIDPGATARVEFAWPEMFTPVCVVLEEKMAPRVSVRAMVTGGINILKNPIPGAIFRATPYHPGYRLAPGSDRRLTMLLRHEGSIPLEGRVTMIGDVSPRDLDAFGDWLRRQ